MGVFFDADDGVPLFQQGQRGVADTAADFQGSRIAVEAVGHPSVVTLVQMAFGIHTPVLELAAVVVLPTPPLVETITVACMTAALRRVAKRGRSTSARHPASPTDGANAELERPLASIEGVPGIQRLLQRGREYAALVGRGAVPLGDPMSCSTQLGIVEPVLRFAP